MANCLEELDNAIAKLHQNFQELRYHLEKLFLEQGLLKFEAQWKDLQKDHSRENEQRQVHLQQMKTNDKEDEKLKNLKDEFGNEVYNAVTTALWELDEYNPSGILEWSKLKEFLSGASLKSFGSCQDSQC